MAVYPPMLLKTRMQTQEAQATMVATARQVLAKEGLRGLYRGALAVSIGVIPTQSIYVTALELSRTRVRRALDGLTGFPQIERMMATAVAGGLASCSSAVLGVPLDVVTQRMQIAEGPAGRLGQVVNDIWRAQGLRGFYRGYFASLVVYAPTSSVWWTTYSNTCVLLGKDDRDSYAATMWRSSLAGCTAGVTAAVCTNPLDVLKTRLQTQSVTGSRTYWQLGRDLFAREGWRGFFRGASARCASMAPISVMMILSYETVKRLARKQ